MHLPDSPTPTYITNIAEAIRTEQDNRKQPISTVLMVWLALMALLLAAVLNFHNAWYLYLVMISLTGTAIYVLRQLHVRVQEAPRQIAQSHMPATTSLHPEAFNEQTDTVNDLLQKLDDLESMLYDHHEDERNRFYQSLTRKQALLIILSPYSIGIKPEQFAEETTHMRNRLEWMHAHCRHLQQSQDIGQGIGHFKSPQPPPTLH